MLLPLRILLLSLLLCLPLLAQATASTTQQNHLSTAGATHSQLQQIKQQVSQLQQQLQQKQHTYSQLQTQLALIETQYGEATKQLQQTDQQLTQQHSQLEGLKDKVDTNQTIIQQQQQQLSEQLCAAYKLGQQPYLKFLLEHKEAATTSRLLYYFHYFTQYQIISINQLQQQISTLEQNQQQLQQQYQALEQLKTKQTTEQKQLATMEKSRDQLIQQLNSFIKTKNQQLVQLQTNQKQLTSTVIQLPVHESVLHRFLTQLAGKKSFSSLRGQLAWPTQGTLIQHFGTPMDQGSLTWDGVLINAKLNQPVYAVADGNVVFAKWLAGYGLLLIVNDGDGYMTLYGRNHSLYKKAGDIVHAGDLVATVGQSGGYQQSQLYFAIRHHGQPIDPSAWCR